VQAAYDLARHFSAELILVHVVSLSHMIPESFEIEGSYLPTILKEIEDSARTALEQLVREKIKANIPKRTLVVEGSPAYEIVKAANEEGVDLIVIATHGQSGWKQFLHGSVTEKVIKLATCPVLTIQATKKE